MGRVVAIGTGRAVGGYALAGIAVVDAPTDRAARAAWADLHPDVAMALLTTDAAAAIGADLADHPDVLTVVLP